MSDVLALVIGAPIIGATLTIAGARWGARKEAEHEHKRWQREKRYEAWSELSARAAEVLQPAMAPGPMDDAEHTRMLTVFWALEGRIGALGPDQVVDAADQVIEGVAELLRHLGGEHGEPKLDRREDALTMLTEAQDAFVDVIRAHLAAT